MNKNHESLIRWVIGLSVLGLLLSVYSLAHKTGFTAGALCNLSDTFSCDIVNRGPYSSLLGIPVAGIGVVGYLFLLMGGWMKLKHPTDKGLSRFLLAASLAGLSFALYLTSLEAFVLQAWCIVCLASQFTIAMLTSITWAIVRSEKNL